MMRAVLCTARPTYRSPATTGSPVCNPIRTRTVDPPGNACPRCDRWIAAAAASASRAVRNTQKKESPCVSTSEPPLEELTACVISVRWTESSCPYRTGPSLCRRSVEFSRSEKSSVRVPLGSSAMSAPRQRSTPGAFAGRGATGLPRDWRHRPANQTRCPGGSRTEASVSAVARAVFSRLEIAPPDAIPNGSASPANCSTPSVARGCRRTLSRGGSS